MKQFSGFEAKKSAGARELLPAGGYVAKILNAEEVSYDWGNVLLISFDILEGQYKDFFATDYRNQDREDKKWRGTYRLSEPKDDGSEKDGWTKRTFGNSIWSVEASNPGYHWDWNEAGLAGKVVGMLTRWEEWAYNGKTGWTARPFKFTDIANVRDGNVKLPKDKPLPEEQKPFSPDVSAEDEGEEDLPF